MNIEHLRKSLQTKHDTFTKELGQQADKVAADHCLFIEAATAKISLILRLIAETKAIDSYSSENPSHAAYKKIIVRKSDINKIVEIYTDGRYIILLEDNCLVRSGHLASNSVCFDIGKTDFEWEKFANELMDYIHATIYLRKEALSAKIDGMLRQSLLGD